MTQLFNQLKIKETRRQLRRNATVAENSLWSCIRNKQLANQKFRRQVSIGQYIVDFYSPKNRLIIEVDGDIHEDIEVKTNDSIRQEFLESLGLKVLRFTNTDVTYRIGVVLETIKKVLSNPLFHCEGEGARG